MKTFVKLVSHGAGVCLIALAFVGVLVGSLPVLLPRAMTILENAPCPLNFSCSVGGVPTWVVCLIPLALLLLINLLIVALARRRHNNIYGQPVRHGRNYFQEIED